MNGVRIETFPALEKLPVRHAFIGRVQDLDVKTDRAEAMQRLKMHHQNARVALGLEDLIFVTAEQVHGGEVVPVDRNAQRFLAGADGLVTNDPAVCLGIYVADCCAVYLVDPVSKSIGLVHSGKKGTERQITRTAIQQMQERFGAKPSNLVVQLSPCIRPPHYEIDFASEIKAQCRDAGVTQIEDDGANTGADLQRYYSYRMEQGKTGRMLALLAIH
jgi:polyphenol oxidase